MLRATNHAAVTYNPPVPGWIDETLAHKDSATWISAAEKRRDQQRRAAVRVTMRESDDFERPNHRLTEAASARSRFAAAFRVLEEAIAARAFPGCAFGVLAGGEVVLEGALGRFTYEAGAPAVTAGDRL